MNEILNEDVRGIKPRTQADGDAKRTNAELAGARAIEKNYDAIAAAAELGRGTANRLVGEDLASLRKILDPDERHFAAVLMGHSAQAQRFYEAELTRQDPATAREIEQALAKDERRQAEKEDRKAAAFAATPPRHPDLGQEFIASLDARMAQADLTERGWRDRGDLKHIMSDLERLADADWQQAAGLWDKYRPGDPDKPVFIDGDDIDPAPASRATGKQSASPERATARDGQEPAAIPEGLHKRYLHADNKFYFRHGENAVAFEDNGKRLATQHDDPDVAKSMVELAAAKGWAAVHLRGSDEFMREAWLQASLRGMTVRGYRPRDVDLARLDDRRNDKEVKDDRTPAEPANKVMLDESQRTLTNRQRAAVETLKAVLRDRGDSEMAVDMAARFAAERFQTERVYVGKVVDHGRAPYEHNPENEDSYYVKLQMPSGNKTVWGVDLKRALEEGRAKIGEDVAVSYQGRQQVAVKVKQRDEHGKVVGVTESLVDRNTWDVDRLDRVREEAKERLQRAAALTDTRQPLVKAYGRNRPRDTARQQATPGRNLRPERDRG
jgi:hypothetical protein